MRTHHTPSYNWITYQMITVEDITPPHQWFWEHHKSSLQPCQLNASLYHRSSLESSSALAQHRYARHVIPVLTFVQQWLTFFSLSVCNTYVVHKLRKYHLTLPHTSKRHNLTALTPLLQGFSHAYWGMTITGAREQYSFQFRQQNACYVTGIPSSSLSNNSCFFK